MSNTAKWVGGGIAAGIALLAGVMVGTHLPEKAAGPVSSKAQVAAHDKAASPSTPATDTQTTDAAPASDADQGPFVIKRVLPITGPIKYGDWHWDDAGVPDGPLLITVDLDARVISVFKGGYEIGTAAVLLGTDNHPTPLGTFPIIAKIKNNVSSIYDAPMPFTMRLTHDGVAIHGAPVEKGYASHGCIGTPDAFAAKLFNLVKLGDKVVITKGKMVDVGHDLSGGEAL